MPSVNDTTSSVNATIAAADANARAEGEGLDGYWRSLNERAQTPEVLEALGREQADPDPRTPLQLPRRDFLQMITLALAAAGLSLSGCRRWPQREVVSQASRPEGTAPGVAQYYATLFEMSGVATGIVAKCVDGRPIKIEGNALHPYSLGAADAFAQASVLDLYDPERGRQPLQFVRSTSAQAEDAGTQSGTVIPPARSIPRTWDEFQQFSRWHFGRLRQQQGQGVAVLSRYTSSPTLLRLKDELLKAFPRATWHTWEPIHRDNEIAGSKLAFGRPLRPLYRLDRARIIACFDADLLGLHPAHQRHASDWAKGRTPTSELADDGDNAMHIAAPNRLYMAEGAFSATGSVADYRLPIRPSRIGALLAELGRQLGVVSDASVSLSADEQRWIDQLAGDLRANSGAALVAVGPSQPPAVHALAHAINSAIGAIGTTIDFTPEPLGDERSCIDSIAELSMLIRAGRVSTLIILEGNPVFDVPADLNFDPSGVVSIHLASHVNETSLRCQWYLPLAHPLECWGDGRAWDGTYSVQQPLILPLFDGKSPIELLAMLLGLDQSAMELVQQTARQLITGEFQAAWERLLHDGGLLDSAWPTVGPGTPAPLPAITPSADADAGSLEVVFVPDASIYDGRFASNGWLQEMPDALTKLTWDNAALIGVADAEALGIATGDVIRIEIPGSSRAVEIPVCIMPGVPAGAIVLPMGYGRTAGGHLGVGVGTNVYPLRTCDASWIATNATIVRTGQRARLAMTQEHHLIDAVGVWGTRKTRRQAWRKRVSHSRNDLRAVRKRPARTRAALGRGASAVRPAQRV